MNDDYIKYNDDNADIDKSMDYYNYISDNLSTCINYNEEYYKHLADNIDKSNNYYIHIAENMIAYSEYIANNLTTTKIPTILEIRRKKLDKIIKRING